MLGSRFQSASGLTEHHTSGDAATSARSYLRWRVARAVHSGVLSQPLWG
jgi:hypothetical protein